MKVILDGTPQVIMSNPASRHNYFAWPSVARLQNGRIAVVASGFRLVHVCPFGKAVISYSEDEGRTYTFPAPVIDTPLDDRDAGILAFAGGTMLYVISDEMIPETHAHGSQRGATYALLVGFCVMLVSDVLLG